MNTQPRRVPSLIATFALLILTPVAAVCGATFQPQVLYNFTNPNGVPIAGIALGPDGNFYGSEEAGGDVGNGSIFRVTPGGALTNLASFNWFITGASPGALTFGPDGNLYGNAFEGGAFQYGTLFMLTTNGVMTTLVIFNGTNGAGPMGGMVLGNDGNLYGTTRNGGAGGCGTVFRLTLDGTMTTVASFGYTNGARPEGGLILGKDGNFYGTTIYGGLYGYPSSYYDGDGTVFKMTPEGKLTTLVYFNGANGANPSGAMAFGTDGQLYGTTQTGGTGIDGTIFKLSTRWKFTTLASFGGIYGWMPIGGLLLGPDGDFYGTTQVGGATTGDVNTYAAGTIFKMGRNGTLGTLYEFIENESGYGPYGGRLYAKFTLGPEGSLYSTSVNGTNAGSGGTFFRLDLPPTVTSQPESRFKAEGTMVTFSVAAVGTRPLGYQWLKDGTALSDGSNITGSQSNLLTLSNLQDSDAGDYSVVVTNVAGSATSSTAELTVLPHGHSAVQALGANVPNPSTQTNASGTGPLPLISTPPVNVLTLEGSPNYSYVVQYTANFLNGPWLILSTNTADTNGTCMVIDPSPTDSQRFYRCVSQ
jgi:uncharacterized repeat protein (TIGR03803 family)